MVAGTSSTRMILEAAQGLGGPDDVVAECAALDDPAALFEYELAERAGLPGLQYPATRGPAPGGARSAPPSG
jgi:hypothetical protein